MFFIKPISIFVFISLYLTTASIFTGSAVDFVENKLHSDFVVSEVPCDAHYMLCDHNEAFGSYKWVDTLESLACLRARELDSQNGQAFEPYWSERIDRDTSTEIVSTGSSDSNLVNVWSKSRDKMSMSKDAMYVGICRRGDVVVLFYSN